MANTSLNGVVGLCFFLHLKDNFSKTHQIQKKISSSKLTLYPLDSEWIRWVWVQWQYDPFAIYHFDGFCDLGGDSLIDAIE